MPENEKNSHPAYVGYGSSPVVFQKTYHYLVMYLAR